MLSQKPHSFRDSSFSEIIEPTSTDRPNNRGGIFTELSPPQSLIYDDRGKRYLKINTFVDYEIANNIFQEAMLQSSSKLKNSNHSNNPQQQESISQSGANKMDRMLLMKAYETILRSEGILPVMDSKIYNLVFKVFQKCEKALQN